MVWSDGAELVAGELLDGGHNKRLLQSPPGPPPIHTHHQRPPTCVFPSGRSQGQVPFFRTSASRMA